MSGNHNSQWVELVILVYMTNDYFVMFEAETGTSHHTYIAIDDVSFARVSVICDSCGGTIFLKTVVLLMCSFFLTFDLPC